MTGPGGILYDRLDGPPPPLFVGQKERDFQKQIVDEIVSRVIAQPVIYYSISMENTNFHPLYGEAIEKSFYPALKIDALVEWVATSTTTTNYGVERINELIVHFSKRRLVEDQNLYVRVGDFVNFGDSFYEIVHLWEPRMTWGQIANQLEISCRCIKARASLFTAD